MLLMIILFFLIADSFEFTYIEYLKKYCQELPVKEFNLFPNDFKIEWALEDFINQIELGRGVYGVVYSVPFPIEKIPKETYGYVNPSDLANKSIKSVAVKIANFEPSSAMEIMALRKLTKLQKGPAFLGCQYDEEKNKIIIVQKQLSMSLNSPKFLDLAAGLGFLGRLKFYQQLFDQVLALHETGLVNNDIKPHNMLYDEINKSVFVSDYGLSQPINSRMLISGTGLFMSPGEYKFKEALNPLAIIEIRPIDDYWALVLSIASIENIGGCLSLVKNINEKGWAMNCIENKSESCLAIIKSNVMKNFAPHLKNEAKIVLKEDLLTISASAENHDSSTNFLGLISAILEYDKYKIKPSEIKTILKIEVEKFQKLANEHTSDGLTNSVRTEFLRIKYKSINLLI